MFLGSEITKEFLEGAVPLNESDDTDRDAILETEIYRAISGKAKYMSMIDLLENISLGNRLPLLSVRVHVEPGTSLRAIATLTESKGRGLDNRRDIRKSYYVLASFYARPNAFPAIFREK